MLKDPGNFLARLTERIATIVRVLDYPTWETLEKRAPDIGLKPDVLKLLLDNLAENGVIHVKDGRYGLTPLGTAIAEGRMESQAVYCFGDQEFSASAAQVLVEHKAKVVMVIVGGEDCGTGFCVASLGPGNPTSIPPMLEELAKDIRIKLAAGEAVAEAN